MIHFQRTLQQFQPVMVRKETNGHHSAEPSVSNQVCEELKRCSLKLETEFLEFCRVSK